MMNTQGVPSARLRDYGVLGTFLVLFIGLSVSADAFLTKDNLINILDQWAPVGIVGCAATLVIVAGGFDLSAGAVAAVAGIAGTKVAASGSTELGILAGVGVGAALGVLNGVLVTAGRVNSFIGTLASSIVLRGVALTATGGALITVSDPSFTKLGLGRLLGVPYTVWILAAFFALTWFALSSTTFGRYVRAVGGNAEAARLSGVRVNLVRASAFVISGVAAGVAGMILASRGGTAQPDAATGLELTAIAAVVIGGTSIAGGRGAVWRTMVGLLILALIGNGFTLLGLDNTYQQIVQGAIIIGAVMLDAWLRRPGT
ncbi:MAG TPA: ABC transporter permease [Baekduia sp.]|uniref:ABC transporter permease n=1 Tax=Baekduia sp. TaxID=2600305 RepID=UPI002D79D72C|nr:ABC transporter permease [Baekduia sp.]HET6509092.1 ABC transporter permease [Baekduia sp.]